MKHIILIITTFGLTACASYTPSPEASAEFNEARKNLDGCLITQVMEREDGKTDLYLLARVAASQCEYVALSEAKRLQDIAENKYYTIGFNSGLTDKREILDKALRFQIAARQGLIKPIKKGKK